MAAARCVLFAGNGYVYVAAGDPVDPEAAAVLQRCADFRKYVPERLRLYAVNFYVHVAARVLAVQDAVTHKTAHVIDPAAQSGCLIRYLPCKSLISYCFFRIVSFLH